MIFVAFQNPLSKNAALSCLERGSRPGSGAPVGTPSCVDSECPRIATRVDIHRYPTIIVLTYVIMHA